SVSTSCRRIASGTARLPSAFAVAAFAPAAAVLAAALVDVGQQGQLARALYRARDLHLVAAARARDPARPDLALLRHELPQRRAVLVVDLLDLVPAVLARLAPSAPGTALLVAPAYRLAASARLGHQRTGPRARRCSTGWAVAGKRDLTRTGCRRRRSRRR